MVCSVCLEAPLLLAVRSRAETVNTAKKTSTNRVNIPSPSPFSVHFLHALKHAAGQYNARNSKLFKEFGTDAAGLEYACHSSIGPDSLFLEAEDLMHADDVLFHTRNLCNVDHFDGTGCHTGEFDDDTIG